MGRAPENYHGFVNIPPFRGSTIVHEKVATVRGNSPLSYTYGLTKTPTTESLEDTISELEGAFGTSLSPSGLSAISIAIQAAVSAGDHILVTDSVYQPTRRFLDKVMSRFGIETQYYNPLLGADIKSLFKPNTRAVFLEAPGSQTFEMQDIPAIVSVCQPQEITTIIDNTWATPLYFRPLDIGVDISVHAGTKYFAGSSDLLIGSTSANERLWPRLREVQWCSGINASPDDVFLTMRGMRSLAVRLKHHEESALKVAKWLQKRPEVARVLHPALPEDPGHEIWKRDFKGASGLFGAILNPFADENVVSMLEGYGIFGMGFSWGGFESLITPPDPRPYRTATTWDEPGQLLRLNIGLEDPDDIISDLEAGFERLRG